MASRNVNGPNQFSRHRNVFADLGFPDAAERQAKLRLAYALNQVLEAAGCRRLTPPKCWASPSRRCRLSGTTSWRASQWND